MTALQPFTALLQSLQQKSLKFLQQQMQLVTTQDATGVNPEQAAGNVLLEDGSEL